MYLWEMIPRFYYNCYSQHNPGLSISLYRRYEVSFLSGPWSSCSLLRSS